jgi:hypothetical protein
MEVAMTTEMASQCRCFRVGNHWRENFQWLWPTTSQVGDSTSSILARASGRHSTRQVDRALPQDTVAGTDHAIHDARSDSSTGPPSKSATHDASVVPSPDVERPSSKRVNGRFVLARAQLQFAARIDFVVAHWLKRRATSAEAAQRLFKSPYPNSRIPKPIIAFGLLALASWLLTGCDSDQDHEAVRPERPAPTFTIKV